MQDAKNKALAMADELDLSPLHAADDHTRTRPERMTGALAAGAGTIAALAASSCCILPLVLLGVGISGAWIGNLTRLAPYQPYFIAAAAVFLGIGWLMVYRASSDGCTRNRSCGRMLPGKVMKTALVCATVIVFAAWSFDYLAVFLPT